MAAPSSKPPSSSDPLIGQLISERYQVLATLGAGGMGRVYLAEHVLIQKKMALKVLEPEFARREDLAARFLQEARAASRIGHENVIDISDFGRTPDGLVFFAMEYLDGVDLGATLRESGALPWPRLKGIVVQICKALRAAHAQGIVHRDLKPENVFLLRKEGRADFVKLLDFGIAKVAANPATHDEGPRLTRTGVIFGTPEYMAPEQAEGKAADHRADIYAAGCVIYHCLTGSPPFHAESFMALLTKHLAEPVVPPSTRRPDLDIPREIDQLILKTLEKDRERRFQSVDELMQAMLRGQVESSAVTKPLGGSDALAVIHERYRVGHRVLSVGSLRDGQSAPGTRRRPGLLGQDADGPFGTGARLAGLAASRQGRRTDPADTARHHRPADLTHHREPCAADCARPAVVARRHPLRPGVRPDRRASRDPEGSIGTDRAAAGPSSQRPPTRPRPAAQPGGEAAAAGRRAQTFPAVTQKM